METKLYGNYSKHFSFLNLLNKLSGFFVKYSNPMCFIKKGLLENFANFTKKHLCQSLLFNKIAAAPSTAGLHFC